MLVVLSDLHFSEAQSTRIDSLTFNKNLDPEIYHSYLREINQIALTNQISQVDLVLAGDIFEITGPHFGLMVLTGPMWITAMWNPVPH